MRELSSTICKLKGRVAGRIHQSNNDSIDCIAECIRMLLTNDEEAIGSIFYNIQTWQTCFGRSCRCVVEYVSVVLVGRSGSVVLCTAGLEDMAVALSPGKCGSCRQILSNNSVSRWLRCRVNQTREIGPTRLSNALTSCSTSLILGTSTTICKTSKCGRGQPITLPL